jgi:protoheme IX farnesyltransferase
MWAGPLPQLRPGPGPPGSPAAIGRLPPARRWGSLRALAGACHPEPTVAVTTMAVVLAASSGRSVWGTVAAGAAVLAGHLTVGWDNDWLDADRDARAGRADKPIARGDIARRAAGAAAIGAGIATVPLSLLSGWQAGAAHIVAVALALAYNAYLKATVVSFVPYLLAFPLLVAFISLGRHPSQWPPWWALLGAALLGTGAHLANAAPDVADDAATGVRGLPQRLGASRSIAWALALMVASTGIIGLGAGHPSRPGVGEITFLVLVLLLAVAAVLYAVLGRRGTDERRWRELAGRRAWFRAAMLVAVADVALLAVNGTAL